MACLYLAMVASSQKPATVVRTMSTYHDVFVGRCMANGAVYRHEGMTVASNDFRLGTKLRLSWGGRSVEVEVTDRMAQRFTGVRIDASRRVWDILTGRAKPALREVRITRI